MKRIGNLFCYSGLFGLVLSVCLVGANLAAAENTAARRYLKCNIHYQQHGRDAKASYANWTDPGQGHMILPVNTQIEIGSFRGGFSIIALPTKNEILFEYNEKNMGMTSEQYLALITSPAPVKLDAFSEQDRKGISDGKAYVGMSKKGAMTALGYPAAHRTPSLDANTWVYWKNRFTTFAVQFNDKGLVSSVGQ
jgi:hypothetical protein